MNETGALCQTAAPTNHFLESWGDLEPKQGVFSLVQPTIQPLFKTRQAEETLLRWAGSSNLNTASEQPYLEYVKKTWENTVFAGQSKFATFNMFWDSALHDGVFEAAASGGGATYGGNASAAAAKVSKPSGGAIEVSFYETVNVGAGQHLNNPWFWRWLWFLVESGRTKTNFPKRFH